MSRCRVIFQNRKRLSGYKLYFKLRRKKKKTRYEKMLLKYRNLYALISESIIGYDKQHRTSEQALNDIRKYLIESSAEVSHPL